MTCQFQTSIYTIGIRVGVASVVQAIQSTGLIAGDRLEAVSKGEMEPVADNTTAAGREKNRRIEIEISYEN